MMYIDKAVESIKLAYMSHTPIVWLVCPAMETANDIAVAYANEHFGGTRIGVPIRFVYESLSNWGAGKSSNHTSPSIYYDWRPRLNEDIKSLKSIFEEFIGLHLSLIIEPEARTIIDEHRQDAYLHSMIIIASPDTPDFGWINRYINVVYIGSLQDKEIEDTIRGFLNKNNIVIDNSFIEQLVVNFRGVSEREMGGILTKCLISELFDYNSAEELKDSKDKILREIRSLKRQMLDGFNGLKWIHVDKNAAPASGLGAITSWLNQRKDIFSDPEKKQRDGYDVPKGILVTGIPGTGKSLMAKEAARILKLPLIAMDLGDIQEGIVGKSEEHMASALRMVDAMAPCVLWIDEIEKAFSGANSGQSDGGVVRRMFGKFLTWMQEKKSFCFVFATSNDISQLPPELFRSERFDEKFYNFMPSLDECADMFVANICHHDSLISAENGKELLMFDGMLKQKKYWADFLNTQVLKNFNTSTTDEPDEVTLNRDGLWDKGYKPQKKLFTGADISAFVKLLKFKILIGRNDSESFNYKHAGPITKSEIDNIIYTALSEFMPYGQTNLNDIALCFLALSKNRFKPSSITNNNTSIVDFNDFNEDSKKITYNPKKFISSNYDRCLYRCVVGAINQLSKNNTQNNHI